MSTPVFPTLSKDPSYPVGDYPMDEKSSLVNDAKMGHVQGRKRFDDVSRRLKIVFSEMETIDKIAVDNFARTVRNGVSFTFPIIADEDLFNYDFESVNFVSMPEYKMSKQNLWTISFEIKFNEIDISQTPVSLDDGFPYNLPFYL